MGIFDALTTAVTGMRAQSYALNNVSGNIANSQTTAFKRVDTSFVDLIPASSPSQQLAGNVVAKSQSTNTVQGAIQSASVKTFMAINGKGYFVVQKPSGFVDNRPSFGGVDLYSRRGDFQLDSHGYLVNGAGYYLMGISIDATTGNLSGSVPQIMKFQNGFLPAQQTTNIDYRANLASIPKTQSFDSSILGSELLHPANYSANPVAGAPAVAKITGSGAALKPDAAAVLTSSKTAPASSVGGTLSLTFGAAITNVAIAATDNPATVVSKINTAVGSAVASLNATGNLVLTGTNATDNIIVNGTSTLALLGDLGLSTGTTFATNLLTQSAAAAGQALTFKVGVNPTLTVTFGTGVGQVQTMAQLNTALAALAGGTASVNATNGNVTATASASTDTITVGGTATPLNFGIHTLTALPANGTVVANDVSTFLKETVGGGAITAYDISGSAVNVQLRWAKVDSATLGAGHADNWNLFYQTNANATGIQSAWANAGVNYTFAPNGQLNPPVTTLNLSNVTVNGIVLGNLQIAHTVGGITQFADSNGNVQVNVLQQNGFPAGQLQSVAVNDKSRIVGTYSNGRSVDLAEITLANFSGANSLLRIDGGAYTATSESGAPTYNAPGAIVGSSLEGSNTDIADEFTKLIITQQAYSANTRVITTTNTMVQDLLNMLR
jgi:flagellar hook protein FlgE